MSKETDLAWAAGFIDGEGCIILYQGKPTYVLKLTVTNTDLRSLERLKEIFGVGTISIRQRSGQRRPCWNYYLAARKAEQALRQVEPYLFTKKVQCQIGLLSRKYIGKLGVNKPNDHMTELHELKAQLHELH